VRRKRLNELKLPDKPKSRSRRWARLLPYQFELTVSNNVNRIRKLHRKLKVHSRHQRKRKKKPD